MFKIRKGNDKISAEELFIRTVSVRTMGHSLRAKKMRDSNNVGIFSIRE